MHVVCLDDIFAESGTIVVKVFRGTLDSRNEWYKHFMKVFAVRILWLRFGKVSVKPNFGLKTVRKPDHSWSYHEQPILLVKNAIPFNTTLHYRHYFWVLYFCQLWQPVRNSLSKQWPSGHLTTKIWGFIMRKVINIDKDIVIGPEGPCIFEQF